MKKYAKSIAAGIGLFALVGKEVFGFDVPNDLVDKTIDVVLGFGTLFSVYKVTNKE